MALFPEGDAHQESWPINLKELETHPAIKFNWGRCQVESWGENLG